MKKLTKEQKADRQEHIDAITKAHETLSNAVTSYNDELTAKWDNVTTALEEYNAKLEEAKACADDRVSDMNDYANEKTEKWQESDAGQAYEEWKQEWENLELEEVEIAEPEPLECIDDTAAEAVEALPEEPSRCSAS